MVANKAPPADAMWDIVRESQPESVPASNVHYVIYGCALLIGYPGHVMHQGNMEMEEVLFGSMVMLINGPPIKDVTQLQLARHCAVHFTEQTPLCLEKETFLANEGNKERFLTY